MIDEQPRTDAFGRERSPAHQYSLSVEQTAEVYAQAGLPRTIRAIQKYCALSKLDCHKVETETGEKYLVAPYSVTRHIAYINEVRTVASGRDQARTDVSVRPWENKGISITEPPVHGGDNSRPDTTVRATDDRYITQLESENDFLRGQLQTKDTQIKDLTARARETNILIRGLQQILTPLLSAPKERTMGDRGQPIQG